jgi:hypothetical protein
MRISQIAPLHEAVPPRLYGGTERIVAHLTNALVEFAAHVRRSHPWSDLTRRAPPMPRPTEPVG